MTSLAVLLAVCLVGPPLAVGLTAIRIPWQVTAALVSAVGIVVLWRLAQQVRAVDRRRLQWPAIVAMLAVLGGATFYTVRLSGFMLDERRADWSVLPARPFFRAHSCLSAYTEAARLATTGVNIFEIGPYSQPGKPDVPRTIGSFEVDLYQYPPAFLLLPRLAEAGGIDFMTTRRIWFALQSAALWLAIVVLARWIGGASGLLVLLLAPIVWLAPTTRVTLQIGNFQTTAFALSVLAMVAFERGRNGRGGSLLGFSIVSKIYPGMLGILLAVDRRWSGIVWTAAWAAALTLAAFLWLGAAPFVDFVRYQVPRIQSAEAFFWITQPEMAPVNYGIHGLVLKLRALGLPGTGASAASLAASAYTIGLVAIAVASAIRLGRAPGGATGRRTVPAAPGASLAGPAEPGIVPQPVRPRRIRARRHALVADDGRRGRTLAAGRTRPARDRSACDDAGARRRGRHGTRTGVDRGRHARAATGRDRDEPDRGAHARTRPVAPRIRRD